MSIQSAKTNYSKESDVEMDGRISTTLKTVSDLIQANPEPQAPRKLGIIAPHAPLDTSRTSVDLQYMKYEKDDQ